MAIKVGGVTVIDDSRNAAVVGVTASGNITVTGTVDGRDIAADGTKLDGIVIGSTVQAYDANLAGFVSAFTLPTSDGTSGQVLATNGSGTLSLQDAASGGGLEYTTSNTNLEAGGQYFVSISANRTLTLPAAPSAGDIIRIFAANGVDDGYTLTVARNGSTINSLSENLVVDIHGLDFILWYTGTTWSLI